MNRLASAHVAVAGLGGVGCTAVENLTRAGIGRFTLIDMDAYEETNLNRQLYATRDTLGIAKADVAAGRIKSINPEAIVKALPVRLEPDNMADYLSDRPDVVVDAIDTVTAKIALIVYCREHNIPIVSCLGTGNRSDPTKVVTGDLADTAGTGCPLSRVLRKELRRRGIVHLPVTYSTEQPGDALAPDSPPGRHSPGSTPMVPSAAGLAIGYLAIEQLKTKMA